MRFKILTMRKFLAILLILASMSFVFCFCGRYENGPALSMKSAKSRAIGEWHIVDLLINDKHEQNLFEREASTVLTLNENGTYSYKMAEVRSSVEKTGLWSFGEDKTELVLMNIDSINGNTESRYKITRLSKSEMWLVNGSEEYAAIDDLIERHFEKKQE